MLQVLQNPLGDETGTHLSWATLLTALDQLETEVANTW